MTGDQSTEVFEHLIHQRLLAGDPVASAELAEAYLGPLATRLQQQFPNLRDQAAVWDAATDAILDYAEHPKRFNPSKGSLETYLRMAARGDFLNALAKERRRHRGVVSIERVEESDLARNVGQSARDVEIAEAADALRPLYDRIAEVVPDEKDRVMIGLMIQGERLTAAFAAALGISDLRVEEQKKIVKRNKDRLKKRLERLGVEILGARTEPDNS